MFKYLFCFLFLSIYIRAQTLDRSLVASQGGYFSNDGFDFSWSLGEVVTDTYPNLIQSVFLTQGFEQPVFKPVSDTVIVTEPTVFPNPTEGPINFLLPTVDSYHLKCYDIVGQLIFEDTVISNYIKLNVSYLSNAYYVFLITNDLGDFNYRVKILKIN